MAEDNDQVLQSASIDDGRKRLSSKKLLLFVVAPLILILGGGAALHSSGLMDGLLKKKEVAEETTEEAPADEASRNVGPGYYYDLPDFIVNLSDSGSKQRFLKLSISLEIPKKEDEVKLQAVMPRISDNFQTYLRELRVDDLRGSSGVYRLRQELLSRVRIAADPVVVRDVLFREILVQ